MSTNPGPETNVMPTIPGYQMLERLGSGASATVYKAKHLTLDRMVAIKVLNRRAGSDPIFVRKLLSEGRAAAKLNHTNAVQAYDVGQVGEMLFFVMEFVEGQTVHQRLLQYGRYPEKDALRIVTQVAQALQQAHRMGIIHCDIKPHNIIMTPEGVAKLADMGLARQGVAEQDSRSSSAGKPFGTPFYISPEQVRGETKIDGRSDIYCLGGTFYHMVTGRVPFEGDHSGFVMRQHLTGKLVPPDQVCKEVSPAVASVIEKMMSKEPADRYASADELLEDLQAITTSGTPIHAQRAFDLNALENLSQKQELREEADNPPTELQELLRNKLFWALVGSLAFNVLLLLLLAIK